MTAPQERTTAANAELALLLEVAGSPKPGNVDRHREYDDLRFEHFLAGAVGARPGLEAARTTTPGVALEQAVRGMAHQRGGNTQFGALLVLIPLVRAASRGELTPAGVQQVTAATTVEDAVAFYRAFDIVDVAIGEPPPGMAPLDVRRGAEAADELREQGLTLEAVMELSADVDGVAEGWTNGFERCFQAAEWLGETEGALSERVSRVFCRLLGANLDTFVQKTAGTAAAKEATARASAVLAEEEDPEALADEFVDREINPGTTADLTAGAVFVALERGLEV